VTVTSSETRRKHLTFWGIVVAWVATDVITKAWAVSQLVPHRIPHEVFGEFLRFTLVYNTGAAFGMHIGGASRWVFTALTIGALLMLAHLYRETRARDGVRIVALALVTAGALGNLVDRLRWERGVVDFIDVGYRDVWRFWTFNVADIGVSCGAVLLAVVLWREDRAHRAGQPAVVPVTPLTVPPTEAERSDG
jgi:signal peptidase II